MITSRGEAGRGIVLVDKNGKPYNSSSSAAKTVTVQMANVSTTSVASAAARSSSSSSMRGSSRQSSRSTSSATTAQSAPLTNVNNELIIQYGLMTLGALLVLKIISSAINLLTILLIPVLYLYASANCPSNDTFDAKKELKRVMRGAHLPKEQQPKGFFEQKLNRFAASVTTELATSLGYEISMTDFAGAAKMAAVKVPVASAEYYWLGVFGKNIKQLLPLSVFLECNSLSLFACCNDTVLLCTVGKWRYIGQREIPSKNAAEMS